MTKQWRYGQKSNRRRITVDLPVQEMPKPTHEYIGKKWCGCIVAMTADMPQFKKETARSVAEMIADGLTVERVIFGSSNVIWDCPHGEKPKETDQPRLIPD